MVWLSPERLQRRVDVCVSDKMNRKDGLRPGTNDRTHVTIKGGDRSEMAVIKYPNVIVPLLSSSRVFFSVVNLQHRRRRPPSSKVGVTLNHVSIYQVISISPLAGLVNLPGAKDNSDNKIFTATFQ